MNTPRRFLFLSANVGAGHSAAAEAIVQALLRLEPDAESRIVNSYYYASSFVGKMVEDGYLQMVKFIPQLYGLLYERRERAGTISGLKNWVIHTSAENFRNLVDEYRPDVIVCTHAFSCGVSSVLKEKMGLRIPVVGVVTDFVVHPFWIYNNLDLYTVATQEIADHLISKGVAPERVDVTGIPIDPRFGEHQDIPLLKRSLQFEEDWPILLVMGGGIGMGPVSRIMKALKKLTLSMHVVIVAGKNNRLIKRLQDDTKKLNNHSPVKVRVLGYINNVYDYMKAADILVTKPGGLTSSEALAVQLPMIIVRPIPGQELRNTRYLLGKRVAIRVGDENNLAETIETLLKNPARLKQMRDKARPLGQPDAAMKVARRIMDLYKGALVGV